MKSNTLFYCILLVLLSTSQVKVADANECPKGSTDVVCTEEYDPVKCGLGNLECEYSNQCFATKASSNFTAETCNKVWVNPLVDPNCPRSSNDEACIGVFDPVKCRSENMECEYSNKCFATKASSNFTTKTCTTACPKSSSRRLWSCRNTYDPVKCGECEYDNQCFATSASIYFTSETCTTVIKTESTSGVTRAHSKSYVMFLSFTLFGVIAMG
ncbi:predicted protein [Chaetoceros tenuissimus]|uniref:ShKT domain-containing protein n=1 Tax=Chaetoceros tenuissimus TaxID=426638 RepID=A0AAD3CG06_9STRA|nr:predicted protein [Chaetoceros tenuissimus]